MNRVIRRMIQYMLLMVVLIGGVYAVSRFLATRRFLLFQEKQRRSSQPWIWRGQKSVLPITKGKALS